MCALALGYKGAYFQWKDESTYGTAVTPDKVLELNSESIIKEQAHLITAGKNAIYSDKDDVEKGRTIVAGDVSFDLRYEGFSELFYHALGSISSSQQGGTSAYKHTITMADSLPTGLTFEIDMDTKAKQVEGGKINTLSFACEAGGFMTCTIGIIGEDLTYTTATTGNSLPTAALIPFNEIAVTYGGASYDVRSFELTLNNNLDTDRYYLNALTLKEPLRSGTIPEITGSITTDFQDNTEFDDFVNQSENDIVITATGDNIESTYDYQIILTAKNCKLTAGVPSLDNIGLIPLELPFKAYATDSSTRELQIEVQNTITDPTA